jgi:hypothetical protein
MRRPSLEAIPSLSKIVAADQLNQEPPASSLSEAPNDWFARRRPPERLRQVAAGETLILQAGVRHAA